MIAKLASLGLVGLGVCLLLAWFAWRHFAKHGFWAQAVAAFATFWVVTRIVFLAALSAATSLDT
jgi:hypothetical protein